MELIYFFIFATQIVHVVASPRYNIQALLQQPPITAVPSDSPIHGRQKRDTASVWTFTGTDSNYDYGYTTDYTLTTDNSVCGYTKTTPVYMKAGYFCVTLQPQSLWAACPGTTLLASPTGVKTVVSDIGGSACFLPVACRDTHVCSDYCGRPTEDGNILTCTSSNEDYCATVISHGLSHTFTSYWCTDVSASFDLFAKAVSTTPSTTKSTETTASITSDSSSFQATIVTFHPATFSSTTPTQTSENAPEPTSPTSGDISSTDSSSSSFNKAAIYVPLIVICLISIGIRAGIKYRKRQKKLKADKGEDGKEKTEAESFIPEEVAELPARNQAVELPVEPESIEMEAVRSPVEMDGGDGGLLSKNVREDEANK